MTRDTPWDQTGARYSCFGKLASLLVGGQLWAPDTEQKRWGAKAPGNTSGAPSLQLIPETQGHSPSGALLSSVPLTANGFGEAGLPSLGAFSMVVTSPYTKNTHVLVKSPPFYTPKCIYQYFKFLSKEHGILLPRHLGFLDK